MRGVFGMLLIGGGVVLMYGLFTGKIAIPFTPGATTTTGATPTPTTSTSVVVGGTSHAPGHGAVA